MVLLAFSGAGLTLLQCVPVREVGQMAMYTIPICEDRVVCYSPRNSARFSCVLMADSAIFRRYCP